ncbi:MAG: LegC family aminotransferase [Candidatus Cloacimonas sp.]|jgi:dTDP-4-amino-4,6-dideoxygalactose transaminase|nr:LegC family aminotransferase [Candidatus Cloacimonas sp.]
MKKYSPIIDFIRVVYPNRDFIPLHEPYFAGNEKKYVLDCIESTFVSSVGKYVDKFEEMIREFTGAKYAIATVNGTAALHIALLLAGVKQGDLVITQPLTFVATCNAISYCGAEPIFVDIDRKTLGLSAEALETWLSENAEVLDLKAYIQNGKNPKPRQTQDNSGVCVLKGTNRRISACVPMHTYGHPCQIDRIAEVCNRYHICMVEDSAESIGSYYKNRHTGTFGKLGVLSFNGNKTITTGGGGMIITNDDELGKLAKHITTTAKIPHPWKFEHDMVGYNYRLPNLNAALGCAQMELLPEILKNKRQTAELYREYFRDIPNIEFVTEPKDSISNYWLNVILLASLAERESFLQQTNENKVMTRPAWILMNELKMFKDSMCGDLSISREMADRLVNIPSSVRKT